MNKKKGRAYYDQSSLHAVSSLPLHQAVKRLAQVQVYRTDKHIKHDNSDIAHFRMEHRDDHGHVNAVLSGRLQRWEGTQTRIDIDSNLHPRGEIVQAMCKTFALSSFVLAAIYAIGMYGTSNALLWSFGLFFCTPSTLCFFALVLQSDPLEDRRHEALSDIEAMMQAIIGTLTEASARTNSYQRAKDNADRLAHLIKPQPDDDNDIRNDLSEDIAASLDRR